MKHNDYVDAKLKDGSPITGWLLFKNGSPAYIHLEGENGMCAPFDQLTDVKVLENQPNH